MEIKILTMKKKNFNDAYIAIIVWPEHIFTISLKHLDGSSE